MYVCSEVCIFMYARSSVQQKKERKKEERRVLMQEQVLERGISPWLPSGLLIRYSRLYIYRGWQK